MRSDSVMLSVSPEVVGLQWVSITLHSYHEVRIPLLQTINRDDKALKIDKTNLQQALLDVTVYFPSYTVDRTAKYKVNDQPMVTLKAPVDFPNLWFEGTKEKLGTDVTAYIRQGINKFTAQLTRGFLARLEETSAFFTAELHLGYTQVPDEPYTPPVDEEEELDWLSMFKPLIEWAPLIIIGGIVILGLGYVAPLIPKPPKPREED